MTRAPQGRSLELFFIDGKPDGMQTAEELNWTGHVLLTPRTRIVDALKRSQAQHTGVYLLLGDDDSGGPLLYVGESENMAERIRSHDASKDWWTRAVFITTGANSLHKAHVRYLEARLVEIARSVGRIALDNEHHPGRASLPEAAENSMEVFLDTLMMVLPAMRIDCFLDGGRPERAAPAPADTSTPVFELIIKKHGIAATAVFENGEMVVQAGSVARDAWQNRKHTGYQDIYTDLLRTGVLQLDGGNAIFTRNYAFTRPSAAAAVVTGRQTNGAIEWLLQGSGKTYKEWEAESLAESVDASLG